MLGEKDISINFAKELTEHFLVAQIEQTLVDYKGESLGITTMTSKRKVILSYLF